MVGDIASTSLLKQGERHRRSGSRGLHEAHVQHVHCQSTSFCCCAKIKHGCRNEQKAIYIALRAFQASARRTRAVCGVKTGACAPLHSNVATSVYTRLPCQLAMHEWPQAHRAPRASYAAAKLGSGGYEGGDNRGRETRLLYCRRAHALDLGVVGACDVPRFLAHIALHMH